MVVFFDFLPNVTSSRSKEKWGSWLDLKLVKFEMYLFWC